MAGRARVLAMPRVDDVRLGRPPPPPQFNGWWREYVDKNNKRPNVNEMKT